MRRDSVLSFLLRDADETHQLGCVLGDALASEERSSEGATESATLLVSGELGAGKTCLVRGLAEGLGIDPAAIASPTFTIRMDHRGIRHLAHLDAWRIDAEDLDSVGFEELLASDAVVAIEWPERIAPALPARHLRVRLEHVGEAEAGEGGGGRLATIDAGRLPAGRAARILDALALLARAPRVAPPRCPSCGRSLESGSESNPTSGPGPNTGAGAGGTSPPFAPFAPFCSPRCRLADLGDWLAMRHRIAGPETPELDE